MNENSTPEFLSKLRRYKNIAGNRYGRLFVARASRLGTSNEIIWSCLCDCGTVTHVSGGALRSGHTQSCGCLSRQKSGERKTIHGYIADKETRYLFEGWKRIKSRCYNPRNASYGRYGARGIQMFPVWRESYPDFREWVLANLGHRPSTRHSLDRIKNDEGYIPGNLRWATPLDQARNQERTVMVNYKGEMLPLTVWADRLGLDSEFVRQRICRRGWTPERAFTVPRRGLREEVIS